jgi:hypothetical protein
VEHFWNTTILNISNDFDGLSTFHWPSVVGLIVMWTIIYLCLWKGIKLISRVAIFTALFPYLTMFASFIRGMTLDGAWYGLKYYLILDARRLLNKKAWIQAAGKTMHRYQKNSSIENFSLGHVLWAYGIGWDIIPALSSYNRLDYDFYRDIVVTGSTSILTNVFSGFVVFPVFSSNHQQYRFFFFFFYQNISQKSNQNKFLFLILSNQIFGFFSLEQQLFIPNLNIDKIWKQDATTTAGGHEKGNQLNQLSSPCGMLIDDDQTIYVADTDNHRIVEWKRNAINGQIVEGGNEKGNRNDQLNGPTKVIIDKENDSLIICDKGNRRVMRWPRPNGRSGEILISNIDCQDSIMDNDGYLYVSDREKHEVRRWKMGEMEGTIIAGGNGQGNRLDQCFIHVFFSGRAKTISGGAKTYFRGGGQN